MDSNDAEEKPEKTSQNSNYYYFTYFWELWAQGLFDSVFSLQKSLWCSLSHRPWRWTWLQRVQMMPTTLTSILSKFKLHFHPAPEPRKLDGRLHQMWIKSPSGWTFYYWTEDQKQTSHSNMSSSIIILFFYALLRRKWIVQPLCMSYYISQMKKWAAL